MQWSWLMLAAAAVAAPDCTPVDSGGQLLGLDLSSSRPDGHGCCVREDNGSQVCGGERIRW